MLSYIFLACNLILFIFVGLRCLCPVFLMVQPLLIPYIYWRFRSPIPKSAGGAGKQISNFCRDPPFVFSKGRKKSMDANIHRRFLLVSFTMDGPGDGTTLLHLACGVGIFDLALRVLERRADVALEHRYFGAPLLLAAEQGGDAVPRSGMGLEM